jgi:hypothetical protein
MKNLEEIVKQAIEAKQDGWIHAVRKSDGYTSSVATVWDDSEYDELLEEATKDATRLVDMCNWEIEKFTFRIG